MVADMRNSNSELDEETPLLKSEPEPWTSEKRFNPEANSPKPLLTDSFPLREYVTFPQRDIPKYATASWTWARNEKNGRRFPQTIAHRGYKAKHPENTLKAFEGAVKVGAHAVETDIHLSKDNVVVISHV